MNLRQHKQNIIARLHEALFGPLGPIGQWLTKPELAPMPNLPQVEKTYVVARVKDDVIVLETTSAEEAQEAIDKAAKQKKAKLYLMA